MSLTNEQAELIIEAAECLQSACFYRFEKYTAHSCTDRQSWTHEQCCRYGSEEDYELSLKLFKMVDTE